MLSRSMKRRALTRPNLAYLRWRYISNGVRTWKARQDQPSYAESTQIAQELSENGIVTGKTDRFLDQEGREAFVKASELLLGIVRGPEIQATLSKGHSGDSKDYLVYVVPWDQMHTADSPLLRLALDKKLLEIVSRYFGMWPRLHAIGAWLNLPSSAEAKHSQLWHRDPEDMKLLKVFIYLVDVDEKCGPFSYVPKTQPFGAKAAISPKYVDRKRILDDDMRAAIPENEWMTCTGPAGTMVLADTVGFHRGGKPIVGYRLLITFTYTSGAPIGGGRLLKYDRTPDWATDAMQQYALTD